MKQLQNNFTTPEQSKRLLELGVPADSADCYFVPMARKILLRYFDNELNSDFFDVHILTPCWSVGRLIEINRRCTTLPHNEWMFPIWYSTDDYVEWSIMSIESAVRNGYIDFSKLEE